MAYAKFSCFSNQLLLRRVPGTPEWLNRPIRQSVNSDASPNSFASVAQDHSPMNQADREAARQGDLKHFQQLAEGGKLEPLIAARDEDARSLLHIACTSGNLELVQLLFSEAAVNDVDDEGWTPLMSAVSCGHEPVARFLISQGAEVDKANTTGRTPLHYAASKGSVALIKLLLQSGAKVNRKDSTGSTALHRAASTGKVEAVRVLVEEGGARLEEEDRQGQTPLLVSVDNGNSQAAMYLVSKGANLEASNKENQTPLSLADATLRAALVKIAQSGGVLEEE